MFLNLVLIYLHTMETKTEKFKYRDAETENTMSFLVDGSVKYILCFTMT